MKELIYISFVLLLLFGSCSNNPIDREKATPEGIDSLVDDTINSNFIERKFKHTYYNKDSMDFRLYFSVYKDHLMIRIDLKDSSSFSNLLLEIDSIVEIASNEFIIDSLTNISIALDSKTSDIEYELSMIPEIQEYLIKNNKKGNRYVDHKLIANNVLKSEKIKKFLNTFMQYHLTVKDVEVEKCFCFHNNTINCMYISIRMKNKT